MPKEGIETTNDKLGDVLTGSVNPKSIAPIASEQHIPSPLPKPKTEPLSSASSNPKSPPRSPAGKKKSKCSNVSCENLHTHIRTLEKEKIDLQQRIETLESHQNTLRGTITAQEGLIKEEQLKSQTHNNLAMMFLDEIVDEGESLTTEERAKRVAEMKEIYVINNNLQKDLEEKKKSKEEIEEKLSTIEEDNKLYIARIKSLEETHNVLEKSNQTLMDSITKHNGTIQDKTCLINYKIVEIK